ncbi:hypothetical protein FRC07_004964 [Ceratobasidium sp. 392]|nr:hypothetical protein FRC07_004964 [Ceratobasidium sp. 392]
MSAPCAKKVKIKDPNRPKHVPTPKELELSTKRRIEKAERDERMDISMALTEVKTYHGGFTKPRMLRASNWFPGGEYIRKGKIYEQPVDDAYTPHTVYILESRYPIRTKEPSRPDVPEHFVSICREEHFTSIVKGKNSPKMQGDMKVSMDAAWWPFLGRRVKKEEQEPWWKEGEDPKQIRLEALGTHKSFPARMRLMRLQRIRQLTIDLAKKLAGDQGGFIGIRFNRDDRGRGIMGERLAEPLPDSLRVIRVALAQWYEYEREKELWEMMAADAGVDIEILPMDDWGRKLDSAGEIMAGQEVVDASEIWEPEDEETENNEGVEGLDIPEAGNLAEGKSMNEEARVERREMNATG